jgi:hypothetical protein
MSKSFNELYDLWFDEEQKARKASGKDVKYKGFSRTKFTGLMTALVNDPEYEAEIAKSKEDGVVVDKIAPVKEFRKQMVEKVLRDYGVDKAEAEKAAQTYEFSAKQVDSFYPVIAEGIDKYMDLGFAFKFHQKKDFGGLIYKAPGDSGRKKFKNPSTGGTVEMDIDEHKVLVRKGGAPKWCKHKVE